MAAPSTSSSILTLGLELGAVGVFAIIAGASDDAGSIMVLFMVGLWMLYFVTDPAVFQEFSNFVTNAGEGK